MEEFQDESQDNAYDLPSSIEEQPKSDISLALEPLFSTLLRTAVDQVWAGDQTLLDFVAHVAGPISDHLGNVAAKGGDFVARRHAEGKTDTEHYLNDQSMRAHLVNGLFPTLHIAKTLQAWEAPQFRAYDDATRRTFIAGYVLHDFLKLPKVDQQLKEAGFSHEHPVGPAQMPLLESIFKQWCIVLGLDRFLDPVGGSEARVHDLIFVACNTQTRWGTLRNVSLLPHIQLAAVRLDLAEQLSRLADLLAYVAPTPVKVARHTGINNVLATLSDGKARLNYHHMADTRGVLSNFIQNAALAAMTHQHRLPLLYTPSGVVYLEHVHLAPPLPAVDTVADDAVSRIKKMVGNRLARSRSGMKRDGKGMKYADYYWLFFDLPNFIRLGPQATFGVIHAGKSASAGKRYKKMIDGEWMEADIDLNLPDDVRVDQMAEWCYLAQKQIANYLPDFDTQGFLLVALGLGDLLDSFRVVPRDNRAGGVGYHWYYAAGHYLKRNPNLDPASWQERAQAIADRLAEAVSEATSSKMHDEPNGRNDWDDLRDYICSNLRLGYQPAENDVKTAFAFELQRYHNAKRRGQGGTKTCALCSSSYRVGKQQEAAILFAPQVYSNKRPLNSSDAIRDICSICSLEMMLRQILMNTTAASGGDFEGRRMRYLYFYPTYFFTPETLSVIRRVYTNIRKLSLTELRRQLEEQGGKMDLSAAALQRLEPLLLTPQEELDPNTDRYLRLHFSNTEPMTFFFLGIPPGRDAKDAEAWVHPALLALLLPLCLDIKVVASESSLPLIREADEFADTVFFDGAHPAIGYLIGENDRENGQKASVSVNSVNVDRILGTLQRLLVGYFIHVDANSKMGGSGFDYRWQDLPGLARGLAQSPLYAFHYLKKWQRKQKRESLQEYKVHQYLNYITILKGEKDMSHARELTLLYRQFYRAKRYSSNAILRPISIAAKALLDADPSLFGDEESLIEATMGALRSYSQRAQVAGLAFLPKGSNREEREKAMRAFSEYFVCQVFFTALGGNKSALRGKQLNLLKNACEVIYLDEAARDRAEAEIVINDETITE